MFHDFLDLIYPRVCFGCENELTAHENLLCIPCRHSLPLVPNYLEFEEENSITKIFYGRIPLENATSLLLFEKKGITQKLIHQLKYRGHEEIGTFLGSWLGAELSALPIYQNIDLVIPVPLHPQKQKKRGFNQVTKFGQQIATALKAEYREDILLKVSATKSQTLKTRFARWGSLEETLLLQNKNALENKHILLVDDLVTTGATLEACAHKIMEAPGVKISIATMAVTH